MKNTLTIFICSFLFYSLNTYAKLNQSNEMIIVQLNKLNDSQVNYQKAQQKALTQMEEALLHHNDNMYHYWLTEYNFFVPILNDNQKEEQKLWFELNQVND